MRARATKEEFSAIAEDRLRLESESESLQLEKMRLRDQVRGVSYIRGVFKDVHLSQGCF